MQQIGIPVRKKMQPLQYCMIRNEELWPIKANC